MAIAPQPATARKAYLEQAIKQFDLPASTAQTPGCQYCHTSRFGGQGWNKFGDRVRVHHGGEAKGDIGQALY
ncbi:MAG TPA: hypothetical protein VNT60_01220, partial [Deinococcales bacterium]|nr:hypothetical protein [Deinococcales bacterium]